MTGSSVEPDGGERREIPVSMARMRSRCSPPRRTSALEAAAVAIVLATLPAFGASPGRFDHLFTGATLRIDLYHTGSSSGESLALDSLREEGEWAGSRSYLIDDTNYGSYLFRMFDASTNALIFSRGYSSLFA